MSRTVSAALVLTLLWRGVVGFGDDGTAAAAAKLLEDVVVTARGTETLVSQTPGGVGLVTAADILDTQPVSLGDVTARIPGISLSADALWGGDVVIRGLGRNQVILLVDDCRVNTATDINAQFGLISPYDIERIEVLKGPVSSLYGSGSTGGVVSVITRDASFTTRPETHATLINGIGRNPDGFSTYGSATYSDQRAKLFVSAGRRNYESYEAGDGEDVHNSQFDDWHVTLKGAYRWDDVHTSAVQYRHYEGHEVGIPGKGLALPDAAGTVTYPQTGMDLLSLSHTIAPADGPLTESRLLLFWELIDRRVRIEDFPAASPVLRIEPEADHETYGARWHNVFEAASHTLNVGVDAWQWAYSGDRLQSLKNGTRLRDLPLADCDQASVGLFAEDDWRLGEALTLNAGGRVDRITAESEAIPGKRPEETFHDLSWNGHTGLTWRFQPGWSMTLLGASSYRSPDLFDRFKYVSLGGGRELYGNPDLDAEQSLYGEYGVHYSGPAVRANVALFVNHVRDLIQAQPVSPTREEMQNVSAARLRGAEADAEWRFAHGWQAYGHVAFVDGEDQTADQYLRFTPPLNGLAGLRHDLDCGAWAALETAWAARQDHTPPDTAHSDAWATVNLRIGYGFTQGRVRHDLVLSVENLLDRDVHNYLATSRGMELLEPGLSTALLWRVGF